MSSQPTAKLSALSRNHLSESAPSGFASLVDQVFTSPFLIGAVMTYTFYLMIPRSPVFRDLLERYCCSHPIEYATVYMFFISLAILLKKSVGLIGENSSLKRDTLPTAQFSGSNLAIPVAEKLQEHVGSQSSRWRSSIWGHRLQDIIHYLRGKQSPEGLDDHLRYLADMAADRIHSSYALVRTITWGIPILGFLGTVIGITLAISNVTPEQLDQSLDQVTRGLGVAFDTTALSLSLSLVMVFITFVVEGAEQQVLTRTEELAMHQIGTLFSSRKSESPLVQAEADAAALLVEQTHRWLSSQQDIWSRSLDELRTSWSTSLERQREDLTAALNAGVEASLAGHVQQIADVRGEFLSSLREMAETFSAGVTEERRQHHAHILKSEQQMQSLFEQWQGQSHAVLETHSRQFSDVLQSCTDEIQSCQKELSRSTETLANILCAWKDRAETLSEMKEDQHQLVDLQGQLARNLETVRAAESLEKTLHGLTAAVHLLTMKSPNSKAA
ncbi:MAG: MotA/TolQ/ExbB proton channel family protein [Planctomycetota bacterium]|nr:MotA/TolQ/ExbB proton channel family protein [Planctomycetota bacterium]